MPLPEFDFIVVGTGAGGGHAAARLVNAGFTVLSLEAGGDFWETQSTGNEEKGYVTQINANDEMFWDWDYRVESEVTKYEGTWAGLLTVVAAVPAAGPNYVINGVTLVAAAARVSGANNYNDTLGTPTLIAEDIWAAINDPANLFLAAGAKARTFRNFVVIDRVVPVVGATTLVTVPAVSPNGTIAVQTNGPITKAQATIREADQSMGRMVGGSGNHFGYLCYRGSLEDYDEWDYAITKNTTAAVDGIGVLTGVMTFAALGAVTGIGTKFLSELKPGDYIQDMTAPYPVGSSVPHKVAAIASDVALTLAVDPTGKAFPLSGPGSFGLKNTIWNRSRMLATYKAIENDLQYGPAGRTPNAVLHASNPFPATTLGYVGNDGLGDTGPWNTAPPATSRVPVALNAAITNITTSAAAMPAGRVPAMLNFPTFHLTIDRNGQNNWGDVTAWAPETKITGVDPYSVHKIPMNEIGKDTAAKLIDGGRQTGGVFHLNKYSERISQLVAAIDPIRGNPKFTLRSDCLVDKILCEDAGSGLTAVGVSYLQRDAEGGPWSPQVAYGANIVVAAGPIGSPAVFLRSGIGAVDRLAPHGIPQLHNLPGIGADVVTHQGAGMGSGFSFTLPTENNIILSGVYYAGLYRSSYCQSASRRAFAVGGHAVPALPAVLFDQGPDMRFNFGAGSGNEAGPISNNNYGLPTKQGTKTYGRAVTAGCNMFKCRSRGDGVRLRSISPFDPPEFRDGRVEDPNAFEVEAFVELATALGTRLSDPVAGGLAATYPTGTFSLATVTQPTTLSQWGGSTGRVATIHSTVTSALHAVSTIKMGAPSETLTGQRSCLDSFGRVYGIKQLAVCDNCVHPTTTRGNPWLPTVAVAENLTAEWIARGGLSF